MNGILIFARRAAAALALAALGVAALSSCEPTEEILPSLDAPQPRLVSSTVSSLTFAWDKVANTTQYTYELLSADGTSVDGGVTPGLKAEFTGLKDNTTYTFRLMAHPEVYSDSYGSSQESLIAAQTPAIKPLDTPSLSVNLEGGVAVSWNEVDNAAYYSYTCKSDNGTDISDTTTDTSVTFNGLKTGDYTVTVTAQSEDEAYSVSETATVTFYVETKDEIWRVDGTVNDGAGKTWEATMVAWSDGSYTIRDWYNVEGYDLEFYVNDDGSISVANYYEEYYPNIWVESGDDTDNGWVKIYTDGECSSFTGNKSAGGEIWFYSCRTGGYYDFVWESSGGEEGGLTVDDIVGTYAQQSTGEEIFDGSNWTAFTSTNDVTITKVDDTTVTVTGIMYADSSLTAKFDAAAATLTFEPQAWLDCYVFCAYNAPTTSVTANISDGVISLSDWTAYYTGYSYSYVWSAKTVLTKK